MEKSNYTFLSPEYLSWGPPQQEKNDCTLTKNLIYAVIGFMILMLAIFVKYLRASNAIPQNLTNFFTSEIDKLTAHAKPKSDDEDIRPGNISSDAAEQRRHSFSKQKKKAQDEKY